MMMNRRYRNAAFLLLAVMCCLCRPGLVPADDKNIEALEERAFKQAAALVNPSIVRIQTVGGLDRVGRVLTGTGPTTGVVVSADGYIISSAFNFASKPASILVQLPDDRRFPAVMISTDRSKMLTLLKIDAKGMIPAQAADKKSLRVGQWSIAMGRTFENSFPSMSLGIVSAVERIWGRAIQTDAKISPVNYGGPLVGVDGKVMGILVPLSTRGSGETAGVEWYDSGIGFAIPMQDVYASLEKMKAGKDLMPGLMGITLKGRDIYAAEAVLDRVRVDSPAEKAGLKPGDVIAEIDGKKIVRQAQVRHALGNKYAGDKIAVTVKRDKETIRKELTLVAELKAYESGFLGMLPTRSAVTAEGPAGVGVRYIYPDSPLAKAGLKARDRIISFNDVAVTDAASLTDLVSRVRPETAAKLVYVRGNAEQSVELTLASIPGSVPGELTSSIIPLPPAVEDKPADEKAADDNPADDAVDDEEELKTGRFTEKMPAHEHSYWAYVPEDYNPEYEYGLMVWIHPGGDTMEAALFEEWKLLCDHRGLMILAPKAEKVNGWSPNEAEFVKDAIQEFTDKYTVDPARIFLHSFSKGGRFAYQLAFKYREKFRGVAVAAAGISPRSRPPENHPNFRLQFHLVCGDKDNRLRAVQGTVSGLKRLKYPISFTLAKELDHRYPSGEDVMEINRWADCLDRI